ncbi:MAG TPA: potassium transporter TrkG, partial [Candidatus Binatia bacterium]|nr:potassium transporter TrkG [Candidatus Binatia bacterium]
MARRALSYPVRFKVLAKYFGQLCLVLGALTTVPLGVSLYFHETDISVRYAVLIGGMIVLGALLARFPSPRVVQTNEGMVVVGAVFLLAPLLMTYPLMASGLSFSDAFFEAVSGGTTTGLSTLASIKDMPGTFLFARSWMQWYGGLGIVVLSLTLVIEPGQVAKSLAVTETESNDLVGGLRAHARLILIVYSLLTGLGIGAIWLLGAQFFDAVTYGFAAISTGGFAPYDGSLAGLGSVGTSAGVVLVCLLGAFPLVLYHTLYRRRVRRDANLYQALTLVLSCILVSLALGLSMWLTQGMPLVDSLYHAPLIAVSAQSTAGFSTMPLAELNSFSKAILIVAMAVGGGVGSTAGGFKILRILIFLSVLRMMVSRACLTRSAVVDPRLAGGRLLDGDIREALALILLFILVVTV